MNKNFSEKMKQLANDINIKLDEKQVTGFYKYMNLLLEWNEKINLTAITEVDDIIIKHFIDSITALKYIENGSKIIDVGTGAGFPGIPLAIINPNLKITLMDSLNKRIIFLNEVIKKLEIKNIETIHGRAEEFGKNGKYREKYDIAISRAVANMSTLSEYLIPFVKENGKCIYMKGPEIEEELESAKYAINELGGKIQSIEKMKLPKTDIKRNIIIVKKVQKTNIKYPRKSGTPAKEPLKKA